MSLLQDLVRTTVGSVARSLTSGGSSNSRQSPRAERVSLDSYKMTVNDPKTAPESTAVRSVDPAAITDQWMRIIMGAR